MKGTKTGRLSQIPGRPDLQKIPFIPPKGSVIYWDESGELMMKMPEIESTENAVTELKPKDCWYKQPLHPLYPNAGSHICGLKEHSGPHKCMNCHAQY